MPAEARDRRADHRLHARAAKARERSTPPASSSQARSARCRSSSRRSFRARGRSSIRSSCTRFRARRRESRSSTKRGSSSPGSRLRFAAIAFSARKDRARERDHAGSRAIRERPDRRRCRHRHRGRSGTGDAHRGRRQPRAPRCRSTVVANTGRSLAVKPGKPAVRQGDVVRFSVDAKDASGNALARRLTPTWTFSPGDGELDSDGSFVAYRPGDYLVTATLGGRRRARWCTSRSANVRRSVTRRRPVARVGVRDVGGVDSSQRQGRVPRHARAAATACTRSTSRNPANPKIVDSIQANTRLVNDMQTTADGNYMVLHARRRGRSQERHRHRRHARSAAPEGDLGVHRWRDGAACTRSTSTRIRSTASSCSSRTTAPARSTRSTSPIPPSRSASAEFRTNRPEPPVRARPRHRRRADVRVATGTTGW